MKTDSFDFMSLPEIDAEGNVLPAVTDNGGGDSGFDFMSLPEVNAPVGQIETMSPGDFKGAPAMGGSTEQALLAQAAGGPEAVKDDGSVVNWLKNTWNAFAHNASGRMATSNMNYKQQVVMEGAVEKGGKKVSFVDLPDEELDSAMNSIAPNGYWSYIGNAIGLGGKNDMLAAWDRTHGSQIADPLERKRARVAYAQELAKGMFEQTEQSKQFAQAELEGREKQWQAKLTGGAVQMAGYMAPALAPGVGMALSAGISSADRYGQLRQDKYETDAEGNIVKKAEGDSFGGALAKGIVGGVTEAAIEKFGGELAGKAIGKVAGGIAKRIPGVEKLGRKFAGTVAGKAISKWGRTFSKFFEKTGLDSMPKEATEEFLQAIGDEGLGLTLRESEKVGDKAFGLNRAWDAAKDFVKPDNAWDMFQSMLLTQLAGGGIAHVSDRIRSKEPEAILKKIGGFDVNALKDFTADEKWKIIQAHYQGLSQEKVAEIMEKGNKAANEMLKEFGKAQLDNIDGRTFFAIQHPEAAKRIIEAREKGEDVSRKMLRDLGIDEGLNLSKEERNALGDNLVKDKAQVKMRQEAEAAIRRTKMDDQQYFALAEEIESLGIPAQSKEYGDIWLKVAGAIKDAKEIDDPVRRAELVRNALEEYTQERGGEFDVQWTADDGATHERKWQYKPQNKEVTNETGTGADEALPPTEQGAVAAGSGEREAARPEAVGAQSGQETGLVEPISEDGQVPLDKKPKNAAEAREYFKANVGKKFTAELGRTFEITGLSDDGKRVNLKVTFEDGSIEDVDMPVRAAGANIFGKNQKWKPLDQEAVTEPPKTTPTSVSAETAASTPPQAAESSEGGISPSNGTLSPEQAAAERKKGKRIPKPKAAAVDMKARLAELEESAKPKARGEKGDPIAGNIAMGYKRIYELVSGREGRKNLPKAMREEVAKVFFNAKKDSDKSISQGGTEYDKAYFKGVESALKDAGFEFVESEDTSFGDIRPIAAAKTVSSLSDNTLNDIIKVLEPLSDNDGDYPDWIAGLSEEEGREYLQLLKWERSDDYDGSDKVRDWEIEKGERYEKTKHDASEQVRIKKAIRSQAATAEGSGAKSPSVGKKEGAIKTEKVENVADISDADFTTPTRNVELPKLPPNVDKAIGANGKPVVIKQNIFQKNAAHHPELDGATSRSILERSLYNPNLIGQSQPVTKPNYRIAIQTGDKNAITILDVHQSKENVEVVGWRNINEKGFERLKRQAAREGGQFLILHPSEEGQPGALSGRPSGLTGNKVPNAASKVNTPTFKRGERVFLKGAESNQTVTFLKDNGDGTVNVQVRTPGENRYAPAKIEERTISASEVSATGLKGTLTKGEKAALEKGKEAETTMRQNLTAEGIMREKPLAEEGKVDDSEKKSPESTIRPADFAMNDPARAKGAKRQKVDIAEKLDPMNASLNPKALTDPDFVAWAKKKGRALTTANRRAYDAEQVKAAIPLMRRVFPGLKITYHDTVQDPNDWHTAHPSGIQKMVVSDESNEQREYREVYDRYHNADGTAKPGWMKAPNGNETKLTERQWVQVRTPAFKKWFGDWEKAGRRERLEATEAVHVDQGVFKRKEGLSVQNTAKALFANARGYNTEIGTVTIDARSAHTSLAHGYSQKKLDALASIQDDFSNAVYIGSEKDFDGKDITNHYFAYPIKYGADNERNYVFCRAREDKNANRLYLHEVLLEEDVKNKGDAFQTAAASSVKDASHTNASPVKKPQRAFLPRIILQRLFESNPVSKVVDENGEPMVVYHRTDWNPSKELEGKAVFQKGGTYFSSKLDESGYYGENIVEAFLNIRNPRFYDIVSDEPIESHKLDDYQDLTSLYAPELNKRGFDGATTLGVNDAKEHWFFANNSSQIKSATDNTGAFDATNPDIRRLIIDRKSGETLGWFSSDMQEVHLNPGATVETLAHEVLHAAQTWAERNNPKLAAALKAIANDCPRKLKNRIIRTYGEVSPEILIKEWGAWHFMDEGGKALREELAKRENATWLEKFWNAVKDIWKDMMAKLGYNQMDLSAIDSMTPDAAMKYLARGMANGLSIGKVKGKDNIAPAKIDMTQPLSKMDWYKTTAMDYRAPLKWLRDEMAKRGMRFNDDSDFYEAARLLVGKNQRAFNEAQRHMDEYQKMLDKHGISHADMVWYMQCLAAKDRNAMIKERNGKENGSGITDAEAQKNLDIFHNGSNADGYREISKFLQKMQTEGLQYRVDTGLLNAETAREWREREPNHVPMRSAVDAESGEHIDWGNDHGQFNKKEFQTAEGRETFADDVITWMFQEYLDAYTRGNENALRTKIADAIDLGGKAMGVGRTRDGMEKTTAFDYSAGDYKTASDGDGRTGDAAKLALINNPNYRESRKNKDGGLRNILAFKRNGKAYFIEFAKTEVGEKLQAAVNGRDLKRMPDAWNKVMRGWAATATSLSPTFAVRNGVADSIDLYGNYVGDLGLIKGSAAYKNHLKNIAKLTPAIHEYIRTGRIPEGEMGKWIERYEKAGGLISAMKYEGYEAVSQKLSMEFDKGGNKAFVVGKVIVGGIEYINRFSELMNRLAAFKTQADLGLSDQKAAMWSRESTVDFNMKGNVTGVTNALWMFSNSTLGAFARQLRALFKSKKGKYLIGLLAGLGLAEGFAEALFNDDEEDEKQGKGTHKDVTEYTRANSIYFRVGEKVYRVPFHAGPFSMVKYAGNVVARMVTQRLSLAEGVKALGKEGLGTLLNFLPFGNINFESQSGTFVDDAKTAIGTAVPTLIQPIVQGWGNVDYAGRSIYNEAYPNDSRPRSEQGRRGTAEVWKWAAQSLSELTRSEGHTKGYVDFTPEALKLVGESIGKNALRDVMNVASVVKMAMGNEEVDVRNTPVARDFVRSVSGNDSRYYDARNEYTENKKAFEKLKERGASRAERQSFIQKFPNVAYNQDGKQRLDYLEQRIKRYQKMEQGFTFKTGKATPRKWTEADIEGFRKKRRELQAIFIERMKSHQR